MLDLLRDPAIQTVLAILTVMVAVTFFFFPESQEKTKSIGRRLLTSWQSWLALLLTVIGFLIGRQSTSNQPAENFIEVTRIHEVEITVPATDNALLLEENETLRIKNARLQATLTAYPPSLSVEAPTQTTPIVEAESIPFNGYRLSLDSYTQGDFADQHGTNLIIDMENNQKFISGFDENGRFEVSGINIEQPFILDAKVMSTVFGKFYFTSTEGEEVAIIYGNNNLNFGNKSYITYLSGDWYTNNRGDGNTLRFEVANGAAKLYLNGEFFRSEPVDPNFTIDKLVISGVDTNDRIFDVQIKPQ